MTELHRIRQERGQPVQSFLTNLKSKVRQCDMKLTCSNAATAISTYMKVLNKFVVPTGYCVGCGNKRHKNICYLNARVPHL